MKRVTVEDVETWSYRALEYVLLGPFALLAAYGLLSLALEALLADPAGAFVAVVATGFLGFLAVGVVLAFAIPFWLYLDAEAVAGQKLQWRPNPTLYGVGAFTLSWLFVLFYMYKRHQYVVDRVETESWWLVAVAGGAFVALGVVLGSQVHPALTGLSFFGYGLLPIAVYKDAVYVRLASGWRPNPVVHYLVASLLVALPLPALLLFPENSAVAGATVLIVTGVYLAGYGYKRRSHVGLL